MDSMMAARAGATERRTCLTVVGVYNEEARSRGSHRGLRLSCKLNLRTRRDARR